MSTLTDFRKTQKGLVILAERDLKSFWLTLDPNHPKAAIKALEAYLPDLVNAYGEMAAATAVDYYMELRDQSQGARRRYRAVMADAIPTEQAVISAKWAVSPLFAATPDAIATLHNLVGITDRLVKSQGRNTVVRNAHRDPDKARWARVPTGTETCTFCLMLASRGAEYHSAESAGEFNKYHNRCDCEPRPVWDDADLQQLGDEGYDPDALYNRWQDALEAEKAQSSR